MKVYAAFVQADYEHADLIGIHQTIEGAWKAVVERMKIHFPDDIGKVTATHLCGAVVLERLAYKVIELEVQP